MKKPMTIESVKQTVEGQLSGLATSNLLGGFHVDSVQTMHAQKKLFGRIKDFILWKTPARRWYYKPFYVQVSADKYFRPLYENANTFADFSESEFEGWLASLTGVMFWEQRYPQDPYSMVMVSMKIQTIHPINFIKTTVELQKSHKA